MTTTRLDPVATLIGHAHPVRLIAFSKLGQMMTADVEMHAAVWEGTEVSLKMDFRSPNPRLRPLDRLRSAAFSPDGRHIVLASGSRLMAIDSSDGKEVWRYSAPEWWPFMVASPQCIAMDAQGYFVVSFDNGSYERWSPSFKRQYRHKDNDCPVWFSLDESSRKVVGCDAYHVCVWDLESGQKVSRMQAKWHAFAFAYSPASGLAAIRDAGTVSLWNLLGTESGEDVPVAPGPPLVTFDPTGRLFAYASGMEVAVRRLTGDQLVLLDGRLPRLITITFDAKSDLWTGHEDGSVRRWPTSSLLER